MPISAQTNDTDRVGLNSDSRLILDELLADGYFRDAVDAYRLAASLAIANNLNISDHEVRKSGHMYLISQVDPEQDFANVVAEVYPEYSKVKYRALELFADMGMPFLRKIVDEKGTIEFWK